MQTILDTVLVAPAIQARTSDDTQAVAVASSSAAQAIAMADWDVVVALFEILVAAATVAVPDTVSRVAAVSRAAVATQTAAVSRAAVAQRHPAHRMFLEPLAEVRP